MNNWKLVETAEGLRLEKATSRVTGLREFTWAHLLYGKLGHVKVGIFFFPSRFDNDLDKAVIALLETFGRNTGATTSVNFWDTKDPHFENALNLFGLKTVPSLVLATGLQIGSMNPRGPEKTPLYSITQDVSTALSDPKRFQKNVNLAHDVLMRCDPKEIVNYIQSQTPDPILSAIEKIFARIRDEILQWKPKFGLPGGISVEVGQ